MKSASTNRQAASSSQEGSKTRKTAQPKKTANVPKKSSVPTQKKIKKAAAEIVKPVGKVSVSKVTKRAVKFDKKITDKLKKIVANYTEYPELLGNIERNTTKSFIDELNIDSVDFVEIIVDVEQAFDITIKDEDIYQLKSFEDLYVAIEEKINETQK